MGEERNQVPCIVGAAHAKRDRARPVGMMWPEWKEREATEEARGKVAGAGLGVAAGGLICQKAQVNFPVTSARCALPKGHLRGQ